MFHYCDEDGYDYIHRIVECFFYTFDSPEERKVWKARIEKWCQDDENLSLVPAAEVPNIRILTTKGYVDLYYFANAFDRNIPNIPSIELVHPEPRRGESCLVLAVNGVYVAYRNIDMTDDTHIIETIIPGFSNYVCGLLCSEEG